MIRHGHIAAALLGFLALAACTSGNSDSLEQLRTLIGPELLKSRGQRLAEQALINAAVTADPESLRTFPAPILVVTAETLGVVAVIGPLTTHGDESVWYSADGKSVAFRDGLIVGTRGLDGDLESAAEPDIRHARGEVVRDHWYRGANEAIVRHRFFCEITDKGPADAQVLDQIYRTRLIEETCQGGGVSFTNAYWIGASGEIRLSRQWISPQNGYFEVQKVQN